MTAELVDSILGWIVVMPLTWLLLRLDESRLSEAQLEKAWPRSARNVYILFFSPFCLVVHFMKTRRWYLGWLFGLAAMALVVGVDMLVGTVIDAAFGITS